MLTFLLFSHVAYATEDAFGNDITTRPCASPDPASCLRGEGSTAHCADNESDELCVPEPAIPPVGSCQMTTPPSSFAGGNANIREYWVPALMRMTQQFTVLMMSQAAIVGKFFDAKHQLETQLLFDEMKVNTIMTYQPSEPLCRFGTLNRALASSQARARANTVAFSHNLIQRDVGTIGRPSGQTGSEGFDLDARVRQFRMLYCNPASYGAEVGKIKIKKGDGEEPLCQNSKKENYSRDINYTSLLHDKLTLDLDFVDAEMTDDEEAVNALAMNLFSNELLPVLNAVNLGYGEQQELYLQKRSFWTAKSIARNSFVNFIGRRSQGTGASDEFMIPMMMELGLRKEDAEKILGMQSIHNDSATSKKLSYEAQMEILSKKLYQNPNFFVGLIDTPANVERQRAALKSISVMLDRDIFDALLRREILMATIMSEMTKYNKTEQRYIRTE